MMLHRGKGSSKLGQKVSGKMESWCQEAQKDSAGCTNHGNPVQVYESILARIFCNHQSESTLVVPLRILVPGWQCNLIEKKGLTQKLVGMTSSRNSKSPDQKGTSRELFLTKLDLFEIHSYQHLSCQALIPSYASIHHPTRYNKRQVFWGSTIAGAVALQHQSTC